MVGVDVQRIRRTLGLQAGGRDGRRRRAAARPRADPGVRAPPAARARAGADRANREDAAVAAARRARPGAADQPDPGPRRRPPRRRPAQAPAGDARPRAARAPARRARSTCGGRCAPRSRPAACRCGCATGPKRPRRPGDLRPLRRLDLGHLGERLLPLGPARAPRLVSQAAQLRLHRADLGGDRGLRARARLPRDLGEDQPRGRRRRRLRLHRLRPRLARVLRARSPRTSTRARP